MQGFCRSLVSAEGITPCLFHFCSRFIHHYRMINDYHFLLLFIRQGLVCFFCLVCLMLMHLVFLYVCSLSRLALEYYCILGYQVVINLFGFANLDMPCRMLLPPRYQLMVYFLHYLVEQYILHVLKQFMA